MELHVVKRDNKLIYIIKDDNNIEREVTLSFVKFAIENHDLPEYFINNTGEVFLPNSALLNYPKQYSLLGKINGTQGDTTFLLNRLMDNHTVKSNYSTLNLLVQRGIVAGAIINSKGELCTSIKLDEYVIKQVDGKSIPVKVAQNVNNGLPKQVSQPTQTLSFSFMQLIDSLSAFEKTIIHTDTDITDVRRKWPELYEMSAKGTMLNFGNNIRIMLEIMNLSELTADVASNAIFRINFESNLIEVTITDVDYRLSSIYFIHCANEAYKMIFNKYAKLQSAIISNIDTNKSYWTIEFDSSQKTEVTAKANIIRTRADVLTIQEMYNVTKSEETVRLLSDTDEAKLVQGLKLGTSYILINGTEQFISTDYKLSIVEKTLTLTLKNGASTEITFDFKGKTVQNLDASKICLIAATGVANRQAITTVNIINDSINSMFTLQFTQKQTLADIRQQNIYESLN